MSSGSLSGSDTILLPDSYQAHETRSVEFFYTGNLFGEVSE